MEVRVTGDVEQFVRDAGGLLAGAIECNILATITDAVLAHARAGGNDTPYGPDPPIFAVGVDPLSQRVVAAALRTPPHRLLATGFGDANAAAQLISRWLAHDPDVPGISADTATARAVCNAWSAQTGGDTELSVSEAMHDLTEVQMPADPPEGTLRLVTPGERDLLVQWLREFSIEAHLGDASRAEAMADLAIGGKRIYFWEDPAPVSVVGHAVAIGDVTRVGPVYTPPSYRGRGYASVAVAQLSQMLLDAGAKRLMLLTDLSNPTSNKIYEAVGYRRFAQWEEHRLVPHSRPG